MPRALEELNLSGYELVISSESGPSKGVLAPPKARHICYCHSPMRYIYDQYQPYSKRLNLVQRAYFSHLAHRLRLWDAVSSMRVDRFVANSSFVAERIRRVYGRQSDVVHPPADLGTFAPVERPGRDYYLCVSELVPYKRVDIAVDAFRGLDRRLVVAGSGESLEALRRGAPENVTFVGRVSDGRLRELYAHARALIFPGEEDFGIVPVEAMACGTPVVAYGQGGARDSVIDGITGLFFDEQTASALRAALTRFETRRFDVDGIVAHARTFSAERFRREFVAAVDRMLAEQPRATATAP